MRIQIILHQPDFDGLGIARGQGRAKFRVLFFGALRQNERPALPRQGFTRRPQRTRPVLFIGLMFFLEMPLRKGRDHLAN